MTHPHWLAGTLPSANPAIPNLKSRIVRYGKKLNKSQVINKDKKKFSLRFINQLNLFLIDRAEELGQLHIIAPIKKEMQVLINSFVYEIIKNNDATTYHKLSTPPRTKSNSIALKKSLQTFQSQIDNIIEASYNDLLLCMILNQLCDDVEHFVRSITYTYKIQRVVNKEPILHHRPKNHKEREMYQEIVTAHQQTHGPGTFPKPRVAQTKLKDMGLNTPKRTLSLWTTEMKNGIFENLIQIKNSNK